jgi:hypothetical protein
MARQMSDTDGEQEPQGREIALAETVAVFPDDVALRQGQDQADKNKNERHVVGLIEEPLQGEEGEGELHSGECENEDQVNPERPLDVWNA